MNYICFSEYYLWIWP